MKELTTIVRSLHSHTRKTQEEVPGEDPDYLLVEVGDCVKIRVHKRKWNQPRWMGPFKVTMATPTAVRVQERSGWLHLSHSGPSSVDQRTGPGKKSWMGQDLGQGWESIAARRRR
uniref:Murine leukemia virus integrase C-terminal domain-containing protein n=1 Tax=Salmo trutta TaxID=8032 RepID=A0A674CLU7_SALTR